ncbi:MAG: Hint domain-containing protein, partial [Candidatus Dependentiae bacterium]|nr:Hint domain-containing protein [Candidatus Dependentiae bacterium]
MNLKIILYALIFTASSLMFSGFPAGTQIKIPGGYKPIEQLCIGDLAFAVKPDGNCTITSIVQTASYTWHKYMIIEIDGELIISVTGQKFDGELIISVTGQKFYNPIENRWIKAKHLQKNTPILSGLNTIKYISSSQKIYDPIEVFDIRLKDTHTFCVGNHDVVVHNFLQFTIGFSIAWGCGVVTFEAFWQACIIGLVALGMRTCSQETNQGWKSQAFIKTPDGNKSCEIGSDKIFIQNLPNQAQANPVLIAHSTCPDLRTQNKPRETCYHLSSQKVAHSKAISSNASNLNELIASLSIQTNIIKNPPSIHNYPISQHSPGKDCGTITCSPPPKGPHGY